MDSSNIQVFGNKIIGHSHKDVVWIFLVLVQSLVLGPHGCSLYQLENKEFIFHFPWPWLKTGDILHMVYKKKPAHVGFHATVLTRKENTCFSIKYLTKHKRLPFHLLPGKLRFWWLYWDMNICVLDHPKTMILGYLVTKIRTRYKSTFLLLSVDGGLDIDLRLYYYQWMDS